MAPFAEGFFDYIPAPVRDFYSVLAYDVTWLNAKWRLYRQLFDSGDEVLQLLNTTGPSFFRVLQDALKADIFVSIARLLDPPQTKGRKNASLDRLSEELATAGFTEASQALGTITAQMRLKSSQILKRRHRLLAHRDLPSALRLDTEALRIIDPATIGGAISLAGKALNSVEGTFADRGTAFEAVSLHDDARHVLAILRKAQAQPREP